MTYLLKPSFFTINKAGERPALTAIMKPLQNRSCFFNSSNFLGRPDLKELSPGPQKWSPNISKATSAFKFCRNNSDTELKKISPDVDGRKKEEVTSPPTVTSGVQRKRKDPRTNCQDSDYKKISRSSRLITSCLEIH